MARANREPKLPELYFDGRGDGYWLRLSSGRFLSLGKRDVALHMIQAGLEPEEYVGQLKAIDRVYWVAQVERAVDYAGPLAGHRSGPFLTDDGKRVLVTSEANPPAAAKTMGCPFIERFFDDLLGPDQIPSVLAWFKVGRLAQVARDYRPGQMLVLAGPSNCGKSLLQAFVTAFFGGRAGKPYRYMVGETSFNSDCAAAEHWMIEDENASTDIRTRRKFGASLKEATVNTQISVHAKGREAITLPLFRRVTLSVNDEPENLMILPPMDESIIDKVMLLKCDRARLPESRVETWGKLMAELPRFAKMIEHHRIPERLRDPRFGVRAYHNPALVQLVNDVAPETRLLDLIDEIMADDFRKNGAWEGTAEELERRLRGSAFGFAVERLLHFSSACGVYLTRLVGRCPERFQMRTLKGKRRWTVKGAKE